MPAKTDRELLDEIHDDVLIIKQDIRSIKDQLNDHEKRIRLIERYGTLIIGAGIVLQLIVSKIPFHF